MRCAKCGELSIAVDTREKKALKVVVGMRRRRECTSCKFLFTTWEMTMDDVNNLKQTLGAQFLSAINAVMADKETGDD
jgi:transcriptional regulator NrdR family protein